MIIQVLPSRNICIIFLTKTLMIYVNHPADDLHDVPNALFLNNNIDDYISDFHLCIQFLFQ